MYIFQPDRVLLKEQIQRVSHYVSGRTLDVGAGTSDRYSGRFKGVSEYVRMDVNAGAGIDVIGTAYEIPFSDESFDSVVSTQVFEHLARPHDAAREIFRVLKPGGHVVVTVPQMNELHEEPHDYFRYTNFGLHALFEGAGFTVVDEDQRGFYYATIAQMRIRHWIDRFKLYERPLMGRIFGKWCLVYGHVMLWFDARSLGTDRKHAIGWCVVLKK